MFKNKYVKNNNFVLVYLNSFWIVILLIIEFDLMISFTLMCVVNG